jgi:hypothetical protein
MLLTENLGMTDTTRQSTTILLSENLGMTDQANTALTQILTENLGMTDQANTALTQILTENLGMTDQANTARTQPITENLGMTDQANTALIQLLTENLGMTGTANTSQTRALTENLGMADTTTTPATTRTLTENLGITDQLTTRITTKSLSEELGINDILSTTYTISSSQTAPTLDYSSSIDTDTDTVIISNSQTISLSTTNVDVEIMIPANVAVSADADWDGILNLPTAQVLTSVTPTVESGVTKTVTSVIEVGANDITLTLDKAVRLKFEDKGGQRVGYARDGTFTEITSTCPSVSDEAANTAFVGSGGDCKITSGSDLYVWTRHFTSFASFSSSSTPSAPSPSATSDSSGGGGGGGGGGSGGAASGTAGFGGLLRQPIVIYDISYDLCEQNTVKITVGVQGLETPPPNVKIRTPNQNVYSATLLESQPYAEDNKVFSIGRYVYEAPLDPKIDFFIVTAEQIAGRVVVTDRYLVNIDECRNTIVVKSMDDIDRVEASESAIDAKRPNIFDVKFQVNDNKTIKAEMENQFVEPGDQIKFSAIIESASPIRRSELRMNVAGGNYSDYLAVKMNATPLQNITNTYIVSADLPPTFLQAPAIVYWIYVINNDGKAQSSDRYVIGVKPTYKLDASIKLESSPSKPEGTTYRPTAYVNNNGEKPLFGSVSLLANNTVVYTSPEQLFNKGESIVGLEWDIPELGTETKYPVSARLNLYDSPVDTASTILRTFQTTKTFSISEPITVSSIMENGNMVARAGLLYSSDDNSALHYRVVAPDGTCIIGKSESCLVKDSTTAYRGNTISIELDEQIYRVRYSGQDSPLERFSITSVDPIVGSWNVTLESDEGIIPEAEAIESVNLKVKYRAAYTEFITVVSE